MLFQAYNKINGHLNLADRIWRELKESVCFGDEGSGFAASDAFWMFLPGATLPSPA